MQGRGENQAESLFKLSAMILNPVLFSIGLFSFACLARPVARALLNTVAAGPSEDTAYARHRCLLLGHYAALIGVALWIAAGPVYPLLINALKLHEYVYFIFSLTLCGLIAAAYPFLGVTWLCARVFYFPLAPPGSATAEDAATLDRVDALKWRYLVLAGTLPLLVITLGLISSPAPHSSTGTILLGILGLAGLGGFLLALWLFKAIQNDVALNRQATITYGSVNASTSS
jgi:hypothetical protein